MKTKIMVALISIMLVAVLAVPAVFSADNSTKPTVLVKPVEIKTPDRDSQTILIDKRPESQYDNIPVPTPTDESGMPLPPDQPIMNPKPMSTSSSTSAAPAPKLTTVELDVSHKDGEGNWVTTTERPDGTTVTTTRYPDGTVDVVVTRPDGSWTATMNFPDGTRRVVNSTIDANGRRTTTVTVYDRDGRIVPSTTSPTKPGLKPAPAKKPTLIEAQEIRNTNFDDRGTIERAGVNSEVSANTKELSDKNIAVTGEVATKEKIAVQKK